MSERDDYADPETPGRRVHALVVLVGILAIAAGCCASPILLLYFTWD